MKNFNFAGKMVCFAVLFTLVACTESTDVSEEAPAEIFEEPDAVQAEPSAIDLAVERLPGWSRDYKFLFATNCSSCHGVDLSGGRAKTLFDERIFNERTDEQLVEIIQGGMPEVGMPPFSGILSENQTRQMLVFLRDGAAQLAESPPFVPSLDGVEINSDKQSFTIELLVSGLDVPWALDFLPDDRKLVTERTGYLRIIDADNNLLSEPVSGMPEAYVVQDGGYLDVAVDPDYENNGWVYVSYVEVMPGYVAPEEPELDRRGRPMNPPMNTVAMRGRINSSNEWVDEEVLFRAAEDMYTTSGAHFGSRFLFDDEGHLFFSLGDRGQSEYAQDLSSPNGKIHRFYKDGSVPEDNPFVDVEGALASIWSYGHRNPQGLAWDPETGLMWESEHGPTGGDERNIIEPGKNYGWAVISNGLQPGIETSSAPGMEEPIAHYTPTIAPSGISFLSVDGEIYPQWDRSLFVSGLAGQQLRRLEIHGREVVEQEVLFNQFGRTREVMQGPYGYIYALIQNPTGGHVGTRLSAVTPGVLVRLIPNEN